MIVLQDPKQSPVPQGMAVALGNFDGLHRGHRELLRTVETMAQAMKTASGIVTFFPHTGELLKAENRILYTEQQKQKWIEETGQIDYLIRITFDKARMQQSPDEFFEEILCNALKVKGIVIGDNFRFGYKGEGTAERMEKMCQQAGIVCCVIPKISEEGEVVCSTRIRQLVREGRMEEAEKLLVRPYTITGTVVSGKHLGTQLQVPTVNLSLEKEQVVPRKGVYVSRTRIGRDVFPSVTNVGNSPTVGGENLRVETHILNVDMDLYGKEVQVELLHFLRPECCFESTEALKEQLMRDIRETRNYFE